MRILLILLTLLASLSAFAAEGPDDADYDYIVVGAGSAGSIVAAKLAEAGESVLLLEAGGDDTDPAIKDMKQYFNVAFNTFNYGFLNWDFATTAQTFVDGSGPVTFSLPRGKTLGGSHAINAAAFVTGHRDDFDDIADELGDDDWSWDSISDLMEELRNTLDIVVYGREQVGAEEHIESAESILGFSFNEDCGEGALNGICPSVWTGSQGENGGIRSTSYDAFLRPLLDEDDIELVSLTFHRVDELVFDENDSSRVSGVKARNLRANIDVEFTAAKDVIVSAGTYQTPKILLLSGVGPSLYLASLDIDTRVDLAGVGQNLRDHYSVATFWQLDELPVSAPFLFRQPNFNLFGPEKSKATTYQFELSGGFGSVVPLKAESVGEVRLATTDPGDYPEIDPNVLSTQNDIDALVAGFRDYLLPFFGDLVEKGLYSGGSINTSATDAEIEDYVIANIVSNNHPVGTAKVGAASDPLAVVDNNFLVHGTSNLRVVDASVFPLVPSGNINAPVMAIALLAAEKIVGDDGGDDDDDDEDDDDDDDDDD